VFIRLITTEKHWELDEERYPKNHYWDKFSSVTNAVTLHFMDVPSLQEFTCPDTSHLDYRDAPRYTLNLAEELVHRNIINR